MIKTSSQKRQSLSEVKKEHFRALDSEWQSYLNSKTHEADRAYVQKVPCPVCGGNQFNELFAKQGFHFIRCFDCTHVFINPQLKSDILAEHFRTSLAWNIWANRVLNHPEQMSFDKAKYEKFIELIDPYFQSMNEKHVLDIGCSSGIFLRLMEERGWKVTGLELSAQAADLARERFGLSVFNQSLVNFESTQKFDLITFWASLEYHQDLKTVLGKAASLLKENGIILALISGSSHSFAMRVLREKCAGFIFNRVQCFNPDSLNQLFESFGLQNIYQTSLIPELDPVLRYLEGGDPYETSFDSKLLAGEDREKFESIILKNMMGYKFLSLFKRQA
ncbi:MAG: hypothetical protein COV74_09705 [Candidatus Omnitrophica bacterium CG11_big_fil_rev_8_21_14_0_20_45_26]|uniref:Uncharacterized protein n=1 Tax=Candidatus Abzuiibacterium crystallinum TaxID=1974748 RepID=A0A2H0LNI6_9BACT|nr:MAG: hypothetical protein COV74_09705 [Candidatus Omnitrophica bacterium CG11_big_fil_rev_8_21_14_0_20_45_26]PIW64483.1 MAG: hypothetical protein COW12_05830 [Candidatus Omnitrophica bacterium CG12_big_fil_rev_8_21_14_0_65_45_16]